MWKQKYCFNLLRYAEHNPINFDTQNGIDALRKMNFQILDFSDKYFTPN